MFEKDRRGRRPLPVCAIFVILVVGATSGRPSFIKVSLRFARVAEDVDPYRFGGFFNSMPVGEHSICSRIEKGGYGIRPYGFDRFLNIHS